MADEWSTDPTDGQTPEASSRGAPISENMTLRDCAPGLNRKTPRGFAVIALDNPKMLANIGGVMRASFCYGAALVILGGARPKRFDGIATDTTKAWRHIPHIHTDDIFQAIPYGCVPVAVDILGGARPLPGYRHPERACYIFGAEDATLGRGIVERCRDRVFIPTRSCMNLAVTVNVLLYDRMAKSK